MIRTALAALLAAALSAAGASAEPQPMQVRSGDVVISVKLTGTVVAHDLFRIKATIPGRVEDVASSTFTWVEPGKVLGTLANKEMAAIFDSRTTTEKEVVEERWKKTQRWRSKASRSCGCFRFLGCALVRS